MSLSVEPIGRCLVVAACVLVGACASPQKGQQSKGQTATRVAPAQIQIELMSFTDSYMGLIDQAADQLVEILPEKRREILQTKIRNIGNVIIIAAGANPVGGLLDMTVMVTLQRQLFEDYWMPEVFGDDAEPILTALRLLEREIWEIANRALEDEAVAALERLIPEIRERFAEQIDASAIRASDVAEDRTAAVVRLKGGGSLLRLFHLDPMAGMTPASQQLAQTRLLAERLFFWTCGCPV